MRVGLVYSRIRRDEKLLLGELRERDHEVVKIDVRDAGFGLTGANEYGSDTVPGTDADDTASETATEAATETDGSTATETDTAAVSANGIDPFADCDVVVDRCLSATRSRYVTRFCGRYGLPVVNAPETARVCADKVETSLALSAAGVPTPETRVAFDRESALAVAESFGYPCVLKPVVGSWGRLVAKLDSRTAAEAVLEHKETLGHYDHGVFYLQRFVEKPGRDLRIVTAGGRPIAGMSRASDNWRTNAARGATTAPFAVDGEAARLARAASAAVGGGLLGVDLMETGDGYTVHEVNHTVEFRSLNDTVARDVPSTVVDWLEAVPDGVSAA